MNANIGYELSEELGFGKVKFINTTDVPNTEEEVDLIGTELNSGIRRLRCINKCSNVNYGKTYTIEMNGTDLGWK